MTRYDLELLIIRELNEYLHLNRCYCDYKSALTSPNNNKKISGRKIIILYDDVNLLMTDISVHIASRATVDSD